MSGVGTATEIGIKLIGLAIILQIIFGHSVAFLGGSTITTIIAITTRISINVNPDCLRTHLLLAGFTTAFLV